MSNSQREFMPYLPLIALLLWGILLPFPVYSDDPPGVNLRGKIVVRATPPRFNHRTGYFESRVRLINRAKPRQTFYGPFSVIVTSPTDSRLTLVDPAGESSLGTYVTHPSTDVRLKPRRKFRFGRLLYTGPKHAKFKPTYLVYGLTATNHAPIAVPGPDRKVAVGDLVALEGSGSSDPDGHTLRFRWEWMSKPADSQAVLQGEQTQAPSFTADLAGVYRIRLIVGDRIVESAAKTLTVTAEGVRPVAHAGTDQTLLIGAQAVLNSAASFDSQGAALSYRWRLSSQPSGSRAVLDNPVGGAPRFFADLPGVYTASLVVRNGVWDSPEAQINVTAVCSSAITQSSGGSRWRPSGTRPNFVIILADDLGYSDIGSFGGEIETPNIDRLARQGLRYHQIYNTTRCWPTRSSLLTGYYAQQIRMDLPSGRLPAWARLLPHHLKPLGYRSYHSGKWHISGAPKVLADGGFDHSYQLLDTDRYFSPQQHTLDDQALPRVNMDSGYYATTAIADYGIRWLREHAEQTPDQPFLLYLAFTSPHFPLHALPEDIARYPDLYARGWDALRSERWERQHVAGLACGLLPPSESNLTPPLDENSMPATLGAGEIPKAVAWDGLTDVQKKFQATKMSLYAAMVTRMDKEIGRVLEQLAIMGAMDNTMIFFLSDNGATANILVRGDGHDPAATPGSAMSFLTQGPGWATLSNTPFRGHKLWVHEGGISTPLILHWPAGIGQPGESRHTFGHVVDILPTILELAGGKPLTVSEGVTAPPIAGVSLVPSLGQDVSVAHPYLYFSHEGTRALRVDHWKLVSSPEDGNLWHLYDMDYDRSELHDLAADQPGRVKDMAVLWQALDAEFKAQAGQ